MCFRKWAAPSVETCLRRSGRGGSVSSLRQRFRGLGAVIPQPGAGLGVPVPLRLLLGHQAALDGSARERVFALQRSALTPEDLSGNQLRFAEW